MALYEKDLDGFLADRGVDEADRSRAVDAIRGSGVDIRVGGPGSPDKPTTNRLWLILVSVLGVVLTLSVLGLGWAVLDGDPQTAPDVLVTVFSATLAGVIGLFVNPGTATTGSGGQPGA